MDVESLYLEYISEKNSFKKEKVLLKIIKCYEPLKNKLAYKYARIFPSHEMEDWAILVELGIWEGLIKTPSKELVRKYIYFRILHQIRKEIQLITSMKQTYLHEVSFELVSMYCEDCSDEARRIRKIDIELAISRLPQKTKEIITLWMKGIPVCQDSTKVKYTKTSICDEVGLQGAAVYFKIQDAFELLRQSLEEYRDTYE